MIIIKKLTKRLLILATVISVLGLCFAGHAYAIKNEIKKLTKSIETHDEILKQISETKTHLHNAATALRSPYIDDEELASLLSEKWMELDKFEDEKENEKEADSQRLEELKKKYMGEFELTAYCYGNITATGTTPKVNHTIAVDPKIIPYGSKVYIDGYGTYTAEDTGGVIKGNIIDIYMGSYDECMQFGRRKAEIYLLE